MVPYPNSLMSLAPHALHVSVPKSTSDLMKDEGRPLSPSFEYGISSASDGIVASMQRFMNSLR